MIEMFAKTYPGGRLTGEMCEAHHRYEFPAERGHYGRLVSPSCSHYTCDGRSWVAPNRRAGRAQHDTQFAYELHEAFHTPYRVEQWCQLCDREGWSA